MAAIVAKSDEEASPAIWSSGSIMTCLAVAFPLLGDNHINNYLFSLAFLTSCTVFNTLQLGRIKKYGPYVLIFPVASILPWSALHGAPDLASRIPPVVTLTSLLIWNAPTMAAMLSTPRNNRSMGTNTAPEPVSSPESSCASSPDPYQDEASLVRTLLWVKDAGQLGSRFVYPSRPSASSGFDSEKSISLSDTTPSRWAGALECRYTDPTLVGDGPMLPESAASLRSHVQGFHVSCHGSIRSMSPVYLER